MTCADSFRRIKRTIALSAAIAHQNAAAAGNETALLHIRLKQVKPRKKSTHRLAGFFRRLLSPWSCLQEQVNAISAKSMKLDKRVTITPVCGSVPKVQTRISVMNKRNAKKKPATQAISVLAETALLLDLALVIVSTTCHEPRLVRPLIIEDLEVRIATGLSAVCPRNVVDDADE